MLFEITVAIMVISKFFEVSIGSFGPSKSALDLVHSTLSYSATNEPLIDFYYLLNRRVASTTAPVSD